MSIQKILTTIPKDSSGVVIYFAVFILAAVSAIAFAIFSLFINEFELSRDAGRFIPAIYAADSGFERSLYKLRQSGDFIFCPTVASCTIGSSVSPIAQNNSTTYYSIVVDPGGAPWCPIATPYYCIRSFGSLQDTNRAIEIDF